MRYYRIAEGLVARAAGVVASPFGGSRTVRGTVEGLAVVMMLAIPLVPLVIAIPAPSSALFGDLADIGIVLVLAYVLEAAWLVPRMAAKHDHENRLGSLTGIGIAGMIGVGLTVLLSAHRAAGHANLLDDLGFAWIAASLILLAGMVVVHPLLAREWSDARQSESAEEDD